MRPSPVPSALLVLALVPMPASAEEHAHHWSYSGEGGPEHWEALEKDYAACGVGKAQSPIDIRTSYVHVAELPPLGFHYQAVPLRIIDNGHSVQVNYAPGSWLTVGDRKYELVQFHFHRPSEERIDGRSFAMVAHLVHRDSEGHLAVVAVPFDPGAENGLVATLWRHLPRDKGREDKVDAVPVDAGALLPASQAYFSYEGSLTTPPCTEGVRWFVLKTPSSLSAAQIAAFAKLYPMNARPPQPLNGREVLSTR